MPSKVAERAIRLRIFRFLMVTGSNMIDMVLILFFWVSLYSTRSAPISTITTRHGSGEAERSHRADKQEYYQLLT
jgi:hypothetical protein